MSLSELAKSQLKEAQEWCEKEDKSTEFMLEYMQDYANVDLDTVVNYLETYGGGFKAISMKGIHEEVKNKNKVYTKEEIIEKIKHVIDALQDSKHTEDITAIEQIQNSKVDDNIQTFNLFIRFVETFL